MHKTRINHHRVQGWKRDITGLLVAGLFLYQGVAQATAKAGVTADSERLALTPFMEVLADPEGRLGIEQILERADWQALPGDAKVYNAGFDTTPYWYRLQLQTGPAIAVGETRYLEIAYPLLDHVDLYVLHPDGGIEHLQSGDQRPFEQRAVMHRNSVFPIRLQPSESIRLYLRVETESTHTLPITLWSGGAFIHKSNNELAILGLYYGVMLIMILYNAFIWLSVRDSSYLSYIAFILCGGILLPATINGLGPEFLWGFMPRWTNLSVLIATGLAVITGLLFVQLTLEARKRDRLFFWLLNFGMLAGCAEIAVVQFVDYAPGIRIAMMLGILAAAIVVSYAARSLWRGQRAALFFLLGWAAFLAGIVLKVLQGHGSLPTNLLTIYSMQAGMVLQVTLLSLALADRINTERSAKLRVQDELLQAREQAIASLNKYQQIVENVPQGIFQLDEYGHVVSANQATADILAFASPQALLESKQDFRINLFVNPQDVERINDELLRGRHLQGFETRMRRQDGSSFWAVLSMRAELNEQREIVMIDGMLANIDERKEREKLARERQQAEAAMLAKSEFLAKMSHEIRTPMNAIVGFVDLALRSASEHKRMDYLGQIRMASHSLLSIISDILDFSKIEAGKMQLESRPFRLQSILDKLVDLFSRAAADKGIELVISAHQDIPPMLVGDPLRLEQVLVNITANAIKFTEEGEVEVLAELVSQNGKQAELKVTVSDTGIGLNEEQQSGLFRAFSQADESTTRKYGGTGLGLNISRELVEMMGGTIGLFSEPHKGSRFWVHVPLSIAEQPQHTGEQLLPTELAGRHVLLVDDNETARRVYARWLEQMGLVVLGVDNGIDALAAVETRHVDLVIMDGQMPKPDGLEAIRLIRALPKGSVVPIILMTAYGRDEQLEQVAAMKLEACLCKPIKPSSLFGAVHEALQGWNHEGFATLPDVGSLPEAAALDGYSLLLVEDNPLNQDLACELLGGMGMSVQVAQNGWEAVEAVRSNDYDAVLMDVQMPVMDGHEATQKIRGELNKTDLVIIGMSANAMPRDRALGIEAGMNAYVTKPIDVQELIYVLRQQIKATASVQSATGEAAFPDNPQLAASDYGADLRILDAEQTLQRLRGARELYASKLVDFRDSYADVDQSLLDSYEQQGPKTALMKAHELKGVAANLGMTHLHNVVEVVEEAIQRGNGEPPRDELASVAAAVREAMLAIEQALPTLLEAQADSGEGGAVSTQL